MYVSHYSAGYSFCFAQVHASKPANLMLRWENGVYLLTATLNTHTLLPLTGPGTPANTPTISPGNSINY